MTQHSTSYSPTREAGRIFKFLFDQANQLNLPSATVKLKDRVNFSSSTDEIYFPIPFKETETMAALKAVEACVAAALADVRYGHQDRKIQISLEKATCFGFQAYLATLDGFGKLAPGVKSKLKKDTDLLQAQSIEYRRMSANLYETRNDGEYFHIHGSLEATSTLNMIGLEGRRPDLTDYKEIITTIETQVRKFTLSELEAMNKERRQAGVTAFKHEDFAKTQHGRANIGKAPWTLSHIEGSKAPPTPLPASRSGRLLEGIKVLELCRIIAGPTITRILAEYGADVLKITSPHLSDVPMFQVDGNMGKHSAELDLKTESGRKMFDTLLADADVFVDGYRPGALKKLGYGPNDLARLGEKRGKGYVYINENCFGYPPGEWWDRPGWQQIADCVTGVAWAQGEFMGLQEPVVPPFPISDYGTGCMGAIAGLTGLYHRSTEGGSWHGKVSLMEYDLLLFAVGLYDTAMQDQLRKTQGPDFFALRHHDSVDRIGTTTLNGMKKRFPDLFDASKYLETWYAQAYDAELKVVKPVAEIEGLDKTFQRASRYNGFDQPSWDFGDDGDRRKED